MPDEIPKIAMPIHAVELQEYLFATTSTLFASQKNGHLPEGAAKELRDHIRGAMRMQRFTLFNWLLMNGVAIPKELLDDRIHTQVGQQFPDKKA